MRPLPKPKKMALGGQAKKPAAPMAPTGPSSGSENTGVWSGPGADLQSEAKGGCIGPSCKGCSSSMCYGGRSKMSEGGAVGKEDKAEMESDEDDMDPMHEKWDQEKFEGHKSHRKEREPIASYPFAKGGYIANPTEAQARSGYAVSKAEGGSVSGRDDMSSKHGDDVSDAMDMLDDDGDGDGLMHAVAKECMQAIKSDNEKEFLDAIRAIVMGMKE